jgi:hypothetical protein
MTEEAPKPGESNFIGPVTADAEKIGLKAKIGAMETKGKLMGVGAMIVVADGARRIIKGFSGGVDEKGEPTGTDMGSVGVGVVEAGAAGYGLHKLLTSAVKDVAAHI